MTPWVSSILVIERHLQGNWNFFIFSKAFKTLCENRLQGRKLETNGKICAAKQYLQYVH